MPQKVKLRTIVLSRAINTRDGSLSLFVSLAALSGVELIPPSATEPPLDVIACEFHMKDGKPYTLELKVSAQGDPLVEGDEITLYFDQ
jgi:hypothetical protein